ncbi:uncharacterized protein LOC113852064 [Abrus precatorius]|uniref:Uncharacterized protein LOC113852064 n=1 Tax=Abrus precatorius TaxID=3816 RepID=A0A8B8K2W8_ABRPR|nr:uncharacterized protein LOC113852064 [Abrus precatorius]
MGCCVSSNRSSLSTSSPTRSKACQAPRSSTKGLENRAPPLEEETVKEVLLETPKWQPSVAKFEAEKPKSFEKFEGGDSKLVEKSLNKADEISEVSEVCSLSESVSTTTFTEEETRHQRVSRSPAKVRNNRSLSGDFGARRDRTAGKSPARRSEQSPGKRNVGSVRIVQSRDQMGNGGIGNQHRRRDAGENSGRRSRSPATRTDNGATRSVVGRSPSARRTNQSPGRVRTAAPGSVGRKMENSSMEGKWPSSSNESLENPLVSLECFIFL